jgi:hypothetical protein
LVRAQEREQATKSLYRNVEAFFIVLKSLSLNKIKNRYNSKNMKSLNFFFIVLICTLLMFSCSKSEENNTNNSCAENVSITLIAKQEFENATNVNKNSLCNAYKAALQNEINSCGDTNGQLLLTINDLNDCVINSISPSKISVTVGQYAKIFNKDLTINLIGTTRKIKAFNNAVPSEFVSFELLQGDSGQNKITNFVIHLSNKDYTVLPLNEGGIWSTNISINTANRILGTFSGYVTSIETGADLDLTAGSIDLTL